MQISVATDSYQREYMIVQDITSFVSPIEGNVLTDTRRDVFSRRLRHSEVPPRLREVATFTGGKKKGERQKRDQRGAISPSFSLPEFSRHGRAIKANGSVLSVGSPGKRTPPCAQDAEGSNAVTEIRVASPRDEKQIAHRRAERRDAAPCASPLAHARPSQCARGCTMRVARDGSLWILKIET